uniref:Uncharacterized protein n=1 Tax=Periophthalmus magnuspinnatus TaxID=409849 RepID=A0A3B3ZUK7_9GOBI
PSEQPASPSPSEKRKPNGTNKDKKKEEKGTGDSGVKELKPWPVYINDRLSLYEELKKESDALLALKAVENKPITVVFPDGRKLFGKAWVTTPYQLASEIRFISYESNPFVHDLILVLLIHVSLCLARVWLIMLSFLE